MGTRSVIGKPEGDGFIGRYCHWDGYPEGQGPVLFKLYEDNGRDHEALLKVLTEEHSSWSSLGEKCHYHDSAEGYSDEWIHSTGDDWGTEWAYVLNATGVFVFQRQHGDGSRAVGAFGLPAAESGRWVQVWFARWGDDIDWPRVECGQELDRCTHVEGYHETSAS